MNNKILINNLMRPSYQLANDLASRYDNSYYLFSKELFIGNLLNFRAAFEAYYPNIVLGYSYKTNYLPAACKIAKEHGVLAEVVSGLEYDLALKIGYEGENIIFNGPLKNERELNKAFDNGSVVHFDSYAEVESLKKYLEVNPDKSVRCALRCNFDVGESKRSRFGFDAEIGEVERVYKELFNISGCNPIGIHCHFSTQHRSLESYKRRAEKVIALANTIFSDHVLEYIDLGGGFFGDMEDNIKSIFPFDVPSITEYGKEIGKIMHNSFPGEEVKLILEPGVSVVANTMCFICQVASIKHIQNQPVVTITGGLHNVRPTGTNSKIPFSVLRKGDSSFVKNAVIGGYTCMETDIIDASFSGKLTEGDFLLFDNMGAYNIVFKPPFIKEAPAIIMFEEQDGETAYELIRRQESVDDIFATYNFLN
jgi:diaminopimelate decarboxylase